MSIDERTLASSILHHCQDFFLIAQSTTQSSTKFLKLETHFINCLDETYKHNHDQTLSYLLQNHEIQHQNIEQLMKRNETLLKELEQLIEQEPQKTQEKHLMPAVFKNVVHNHAFYYQTLLSGMETTMKEQLKQFTQNWYFLKDQDMPQLPLGV